MRDELVAIPLVVLISISLFFIFYDGSGALGSGYSATLNNPYGYPYVYDWTGRAFAYFGNFTEIDPNERGSWWTYLNTENDTIPDDVYYILWDNNTSWFWERTGYYAYYTPNGNASSEVPMTSEDFEQFGNAYLTQGKYTLTADYSSSYGVIALAIGLLVVVAIIGFNVVGSGENQTSTKFLITGISLLALWGVFSVIALLKLALVPYGLGSIFYFIMTAFYCLGIFMKGTE